MSKIKSEEGRKREGEKALISFLCLIYTNKDLTLKANSKIKGMKIPCSKIEAQSRVGCTKNNMKAESAFCAEKLQQLQTVAISCSVVRIGHIIYRGKLLKSSFQYRKPCVNMIFLSKL